MSDADDLDLIAAEYVLGTLDDVERAEAEQRRRRDPAFAAAVAAWEERLGPLSESVAPVNPPDWIRESLLRRVFPDMSGQRETGRAEVADGAPSADVIVLRRRMRQWRGVALASAALAAALLVWVSVGPRVQAPPEMVAVLEKAPDSAPIVLAVNLKTRELTVHPTSAAPPPDRSLELWIIDPSLGPPRSLGVIDVAHGNRESLKDIDPAVIGKALYAVTVEPVGGAPGGKPSGPPVWTGRLQGVQL